ncbi:MAG: cell division protein FtsZ [Alphaproteobacteria bacterium]|nr:MAG: cell division protein FtsZ [Alphaproteobacteria bacterium]
MITLSVADPDLSTMSPRLTVLGIGGAGNNAVDNMIRANLQGVDFISANTDAQALEGSLAPKKIHLGPHTTRGLGAGARPDIGRAAAEEQLDEIMAALEGSNMLFIAAGMGGGTGTGAAPVVARAAREAGMLTVAVVTKPFQFEGAQRMRTAEAGMAELQQYVDTLIAIPNQNLFRIANEKTTFVEAFRMADEVLHCGVRGVTDLIVVPGIINLDFADIRSVMSGMGRAMMGTGEAEGQGRATSAAEAAIANPLLDEVSMKGARSVLINITSGPDMTLFEVDQAVSRIREEIDADDANIIFGTSFSEDMEGRLRVSVVATGMDVGEAVGTNTNAGGVVHLAHERSRGASLRTYGNPPAQENIYAAAPRMQQSVAQTSVYADSARVATPMAATGTDSFMAPRSAQAPMRAPASAQGGVAVNRYSAPPQSASSAPVAAGNDANLFDRAPPPATAPASAPSDSGNLSVNPQEKPRLSGREEPTAERMDIPTFLRRQSN